MKVFMYNVLFDFTKTDGLFEDDPDPLPKNELDRSKHWLEEQGPKAWRDLGVASSLLVRNKGAQNEIRIRVASQNAPANASVQLVVCFGRPVKFGHKRGSPFDDSKPSHATFVKNTFMFFPVPIDPSSGGWTVNLGRVVGNPNDPSGAVVHRYEFALGVIVTDTATGDEHHYGEDPEMDVGD